MAKTHQKYYFKTEAGSELIPIANGTYYTDDMDEGYNNGQVYLTFLDVNGDRITPTGGTVTFSGTPDGEQYLAGTNTQVNATDVESTDPATYTPPQFGGNVSKTKLILAGITGTGVVSVKAFHWRYED